MATDFYAVIARSHEENNIKHKFVCIWQAVYLLSWYNSEAKQHKFIMFNHNDSQSVLQNN